MTTAAAKTTAKKTKLAATAKLIADRYQQEVKGHEAFLTSEMRFAMLTQAMYNLMVNRYHPDDCHEEGIGVYVKAMGECIDHLEL